MIFSSLWFGSLEEMILLFLSNVCDVREGVVEMVVLHGILIWPCACDYVEGVGALTLVYTALM